MVRKAHILVVDDDPETLELIELTLKTAGYQVRLAPGGEEGLRLARSESFDLIILDVMMPDVSGFDVLRLLLDGSNPAPPVIMLTAMNKPEDRETGISLGAFSYLGKPVTRGRLLDVIQEVIGATSRTDAPS